MRVSEQEYEKIMSGRRPSTKYQVAPVAPPPRKKVIRQSSKGPNKTELRFEQDFLKYDQSIRSYDFEAIVLKLANGCVYRTDWFVHRKDGQIEIHEVKGGFAYEDSLVKLKVAASKYPMFKFFIHQWKGGEWINQEVRA
jgi:hypothetical protein